MVADDASNDARVRLLRRGFPHIALMPLGHNLGAYARTLAPRQVRTSYVAFCDDDTRWDAGGSTRTNSRNSRKKRAMEKCFPEALLVRQKCLEDDKAVRPQEGQRRALPRTPSRCRNGYSTEAISSPEAHRVWAQPSCAGASASRA